MGRTPLNPGASPREVETAKPRCQSNRFRFVQDRRRENRLLDGRDRRWLCAELPVGRPAGLRPVRDERASFRPDPVTDPFCAGQLKIGKQGDPRRLHDGSGPGWSQRTGHFNPVRHQWHIEIVPGEERSQCRVYETRRRWFENLRRQHRIGPSEDFKGDGLRRRAFVPAVIVGRDRAEPLAVFGCGAFRTAKRGAQAYVSHPGELVGVPSHIDPVAGQIRFGIRIPGQGTVPIGHRAGRSGLVNEAWVAREQGADRQNISQSQEGSGVHVFRLRATSIQRGCGRLQPTASFCKQIVTTPT